MGLAIFTPEASNRATDVIPFTRPINYNLERLSQLPCDRRATLEKIFDSNTGEYFLKATVSARISHDKVNISRILPMNDAFVDQPITQDLHHKFIELEVVELDSGQQVIHRDSFLAELTDGDKYRVIEVTNSNWVMKYNRENAEYFSSAEKLFIKMFVQDLIVGSVTLFDLN